MKLNRYWIEPTRVYTAETGINGKDCYSLICLINGSSYDKQEFHFDTLPEVLTKITELDKEEDN